jgi:transcription elongation GreA/GreB family factor
MAAPAAGDDLMTREGYDRLRQELLTLMTTERSKVAERLRGARQDGGDPAENGALIDALAEQSLLESRINNVKARLVSARIAPATDDGSAGIGCSVRLRTSTGQIVE